MPAKLTALSMRLDDLELHTCSENLLTRGKPKTAEIVRWAEGSKGKYNYTLAFWERDSEGYFMKFVGDRPFSMDVDHALFWTLCKQWQEHLDKHYDAEED